jgi:DNA repair photolyase
MTMQAIYEPKGKAREYAPLALNLYRGCSHGCRYCYAPSATCTDRATFAQAAPRLGIIEAAEAQLIKEAWSPGLFEQMDWLDPVLLCFTCDPYQPADDKYRLARAAIDLLHRYGHGVHVLTKGGLSACRDFRGRPGARTRDSGLGSHPDDAFACTLTFIHEGQSLEWEPEAASPRARISALREAHERGITTWASLEPVIDPEQSLELIRRTAAFVDLYKVGRWNYDARAKEIDWPAFGTHAMALCESLGKPYYLKHDLRVAMAA